MSDDEPADERLRFYGAGDLSTYWQLGRAIEMAEGFDARVPSTDVVDYIELQNVTLFIDAGIFPSTYSDEQRAETDARLPKIRSAIARFFQTINNSNASEIIAGVDREYHPDLLELLGRNRVFQRCDAETILTALDRSAVTLDEMLACRKLVQAYDTQIRDRIMSSARNAELLVRKYMQKGVEREIYLPKSFSSDDSREVLLRYVESDHPNLNVVELIETSPVDSRSGVDPKLKLLAKRCKDRIVKELISDNPGIRVGYDVRISATQSDPVIADLEGTISTLTYGRDWLNQTTENPSVLNNFQHLFEFADSNVILLLPSYPAQLGVFERFLTTTGRTDYHVGAAFRAADMISLLQIRLYRDFLATKSIELEDVISWFFEAYLPEEFGADKFSFVPSETSSSYLQRARHLFAELESVVSQFSLYVRNGELDRELHAITSDPVVYKNIPSLLPGKYVYAVEGEEVGSVLRALFSDQSGLTYVSGGIQARSAAELLIDNQVFYDDFSEPQKREIDFLLRLDILKHTSAGMHFSSPSQFRILNSIYNTQATSFYRLSDGARAEVVTMMARGWLRRDSSLLTEPEGSYFNYYLNKVEFSNGPELRNKYLHGSQGNDKGEDAHFHTYLIALRLIVSLVIKLNDDFVLSSELGGVRE